MDQPEMASPRRDPSTTGGSGRDVRSLVVASFLMPAGVVLSFPLAFVVSEVLLGLRDLEGSEPMSEQGLLGWLVLFLGAVVILPMPMWIGIGVGRAARRRGAGRWALGAIGLNAVAAVLLMGAAALSAF